MVANGMPVFASSILIFAERGPAPGETRATPRTHVLRDGKRAKRAIGSAIARAFRVFPDVFF
jgi:hypothetical protein